MLEIAFTESAIGTLKIAKNYNQEGFSKSMIGYIGPKPTQEDIEEMYAGEAIGGSPQEVAGFELNLDIGDISGDFYSKSRRAFYQKQRIQSTEKVNEFLLYQQANIMRILQYAKKGGPIRVWKSDTPNSECSFAFLCYLLQDVDCQISVVSLPRHSQEGEDTLLTHLDWGNIAPGKVYRYLPLEKPLYQSEKHYYSDVWEDLRTENSPLRTIINGQLLSVSEDFYDFFIDKEIPEEEFSVGLLVANLFANYDFGVPDTWYYLRIKKFIEEGTLTIVEEDKSAYSYGTVLKRS